MYFMYVRYRTENQLQILELDLAAFDVALLLSYKEREKQKRRSSRNDYLNVCITLKVEAEKFK